MQVQDLSMQVDADAQKHADIIHLGLAIEKENAAAKLLPLVAGGARASYAVALATIILPLA